MQRANFLHRTFTFPQNSASVQAGKWNIAIVNIKKTADGPGVTPGACFERM